MSMPVFKPSKGDSLVVRSTLGVVADNNARSANLPITMKDFAGRRPHTQGATRFGQLSQSSFFARHNPQSKRVKHIKGLLDFPICAVNDAGYIANARMSLTPSRRPATTDDAALLRRSWPDAAKAKPTRLGRLPVHAINYHPNHINPSLQNHQVNFLNGGTQYGRFPLSYKERADPKFGMIPVTDRWRDELRAMTEEAGLGLPKEIKDAQAEQPKRTSVYSADTGRLIPPPSRAATRGGSRGRHHENDLMYHIAAEGSHEALVLEMLCQILQTDSLTAVQSWLVSAGERERVLVLDMIRNAMNSEADYYQRTVDVAYNDDPPQQRPLSQPPPNMNLANGYAEVDRPSPPNQFAGQDLRYQAVAEATGRLRTPMIASDQEKTLFEDQDHPALRPRSHKPDVFKIDHDSPRPATKNGHHPSKLPPLSPRQEGKARSPGRGDMQAVGAWKPDDAVV